MFAILSDIHSNLEALTTVLADIKKRGIKTIYCLGDVIGYGPNPQECLDLIIEKVVSVEVREPSGAGRAAFTGLGRYVGRGGIAGRTAAGCRRVPR